MTTSIRSHNDVAQLLVRGYLWSACDGQRIVSSHKSYEAADKATKLNSCTLVNLLDTFADLERQRRVWASLDAEAARIEREIEGRRA